MIAIAPNNADSYRTNAEAYIQQLQQLDNEFQQKLAPAAGCNFITFHDAFPFLATAAGIGATSGVVGMVISGAVDLPSGPSIVLVQLFGFLVAALCCRQS